MKTEREEYLKKQSPDTLLRYLDEAHAMTDYYANAAEILVAFMRESGIVDTCFLWLKEKHTSEINPRAYCDAAEYLSLLTADD